MISSLHCVDRIAIMSTLPETAFGIACVLVQVSAIQLGEDECIDAVRTHARGQKHGLDQELQTAQFYSTPMGQPLSHPCNETACVKSSKQSLVCGGMFCRFALATERNGMRFYAHTAEADDGPRLPENTGRWQPLFDCFHDFTAFENGLTR